MYLIILRIFLFFSLFSSAFALPEDHNKPAYLSADSADLNQESRKSEYVGHVEFDQGTTHLRAQRVVTKTDEKNKLIQALAFGDEGNPAHYWEQVQADKPILHAYALEIRYHAKQHLVELIGQAKITQGEDSFSAPKISYDTLKKHVLAFGDKEHPSVIIVHPKAGDKKL